MCGRYALFGKPETLARKLTVAADGLRGFRPRYNIAPGQPILIVRAVGVSGSERATDWLNWGLIPSWAEDPKIGYRMINARAESAAGKPAFRVAMRHRRCLIPASGFFEWERTGSALARGKQPFFIHPPNNGGDALFALAGIWEHWSSPDGSEIHSCAILTTEANARMKPLHDRMPVILNPGSFEEWLDPGNPKPDTLRHLLVPAPDHLLAMHPVTHSVNAPRNDDPSLIEPVNEPEAPAWPEPGPEKDAGQLGLFD